MIKTLRSLIQEKFPVELRVKIELLSRRRDITNKEKQDELFKLLREFSIENIVPLGPGTNRYAFKLDGFVIKVATDHDGKIDNLKEFKMAKRLYPYVTKTYEVSENGTLLVAEYIQPFASYGEMLNYADKIREILTKLSSVYLIGDVGITSKNFANWGLRIGGVDPVCLDFAYVYEVSSELFICPHCKTGTMLVPNKDFTELICPQPGCGHKYLFEDIRSKIGNDIHNHEIGDLTEEGYLLADSNVTTELTLGRSNYLARKSKIAKKKVQPKPKEEIVLDNFVMEHEPSYYNGISTSKILRRNEIMSNTVLQAAAADVAKRTMNEGVVIRAKARVVSNRVKPEAKPAPVIQKDPEPEEHSIESTLAFSGDMEISESMKEEPEQPAIQMSPKVTKAEAVIYPTDKVESIPIVISAKATPVKEVQTPKSNPPVVKTETVIKTEEKIEIPDEDAGMFSKAFKEEINNAFSTISNKVGTDLHIRSVFDDVKGNIRAKKMFPEQFYKGVQNAVFRSLMSFCNFGEKDIPNTYGKRYHKEFRAPDQLEDMTYTPTMIFISRLWSDEKMCAIENPEEMLRLYRDKFSDFDGFQSEWVEIFKNRLRGKIQIDESGLNKVVEAVSSVWVARISAESEEHSHEEEHSGAPVTEETPVEEEQPEPVKQEEAEVRKILAGHETSENGSLPEIAGSYSMNSGEPAEEESEFNEEGYYEDDTTPKYLSVEIYPDEDMDVIKVKSGEAYGDVSIPFYTKLDEVDLKEIVPSIADERNGIWDWLIHMVPDMMFETPNPDEWLTINETPVEEEQAHIVILNEENGVYTMGIFFITGIWIVDEEGNGNQVTDLNTLAKLNKVISEDIGYSRISHLRRSLQMTELIQPEKYIRACFVQDDYDEEEEGMVSGENAQTIVEEQQENMSDLEAAAIAALSGAPVTEETPVEEEQPEPEETFEMRSEDSETENDKYEEFVNSDPKLAKVNGQQTFTPIRRKNRGNN